MAPPVSGLCRLPHGGSSGAIPASSQAQHTYTYTYKHEHTHTHTDDLLDCTTAYRLRNARPKRRLAKKQRSPVRGEPLTCTTCGVRRTHGCACPLKSLSRSSLEARSFQMRSGGGGGRGVGDGGAGDSNTSPAATAAFFCCCVSCRKSLVNKQSIFTSRPLQLPSLR